MVYSYWVYRICLAHDPRPYNLRLYKTFREKLHSCTQSHLEHGHVENLETAVGVTLKDGLGVRLTTFRLRISYECR